jgi:hypothetical protein
VTAPDYTSYYYLETYLFHEVSPRYHSSNKVSTFDFFCIVIWKANRAKSKVANRLLNQGYSDLDSAVAALIEQIGNATDDKSRLKVLISDWGFRLPMASAILTVLYPESFTIYDVRVCNILGDYGDAQYKYNFEDLWNRYAAFVHSVRQRVPEINNLRDKDRYLWGQSFENQLKNDIAHSFKRAVDEKGFKA